MKIYISGKISGEPLDVVKQRFADAENLLNDMNAFDEICNPINNGLPDCASWNEHMVKDIEMLLSCDAIYLMDNWTESTWASIEYDIANRMGMDIYFATHEVECNKSIMKIKCAIHEATGLHFRQYANNSRKRDKVFARMIFVHHCRENKMRLIQIGKYINRDHTSILHLLNKYNDDFRFNDIFRTMATRVNEILNRNQDVNI